MKRTLFFFVLLSFASFRMQAQEATSRSADLNLIPEPVSVQRLNGSFEITSETTILSPDSFNAAYLKNKLNGVTGFPVEIRQKPARKDNEINCILLEPFTSKLPEEGYELKVTPDKIVVRSGGKAGTFYAIQTLLQLLPPSVYGTPSGFEKWEIPAVEITDYPRFSYRGMMLDVSRTFFGMDILYKYIDWLAYHKINKFHLHLADDNGWRIEIRKYPPLTEKAAWRGPEEVLPPAFGSGNKKYGGYYTQKQMRELIRYAADRNIEIIPEIDLPGHSKAVAACYDILCTSIDDSRSVQGESGNVWCVGNESNYEMLDNIIRELAALFPGKYIHIGGDEVNINAWKNCERCRALMSKEGMKSEKELLYYFAGRLEKILSKYGKKLAGWDDIMEKSNIKKNTLVYAWRSPEKAAESLEKGYPTVFQIASYYYLDMKQSSRERGHNWAGIRPLEKIYSFHPASIPDLAGSKRKKIKGVQAGLWTELLNKPPRFIEYQTFPRLCALAETGWTPPESRRWEDFYDKLTGTHFERLYQMGIAFRLPPPAVAYENNELKATLPYPSAVVRYTTDGTDPDYSSAVYAETIPTSEPERFRFATFYGNTLKSISVQAENIRLHTFLTPETKIETNMKENTRFPKRNLADYDFKTYFRSSRRAIPGDYLTYIFENPVLCRKITVDTGIPDITLYGVTEGYVSYSHDGKNYIKGEIFKDNSAVIYPDGPVKSVRIVVTGTSDGPCLSLQDLRIEK